MGLLVVYALKMKLALAAIQVNVQIRSGVKTGNVQFLKMLSIVMSAMNIAEKDY
ncbi:hypothetical protein RUMHYD_01367 [Blautia hydrogenotrophica DSM 10507]|uniref:Uncharacterized protein n=1 Tax=Blautia hydrogenotrophica (strain DSM 10507 / JCM 14656 / S5a33) TaxID=476272 RepID=C0CKJ7_BLAHS|nr:hypothetical protein RUMHYD_01367 [Blautia hydrogenotrophica DSM 10507]